jgi:hypothetical protein
MKSAWDVPISAGSRPMAPSSVPMERPGAMRRWTTTEPWASSLPRWARPTKLPAQRARADCEWHVLLCSARAAPRRRCPYPCAVSLNRVKAGPTRKWTRTAPAQAYSDAERADVHQVRGRLLEVRKAPIFCDLPALLRSSWPSHIAPALPVVRLTAPSGSRFRRHCADTALHCRPGTARYAATAAR